MILLLTIYFTLVKSLSVDIGFSFSLTPSFLPSNFLVGILEFCLNFKEQICSFQTLLGHRRVVSQQTHRSDMKTLYQKLKVLLVEIHALELWGRLLYFIIWFSTEISYLIIRSIFSFMSFNIFLADAFKSLPGSSNIWVVLGSSLTTFLLTMAYIFLFKNIYYLYIQ